MTGAKEEARTPEEGGPPKDSVDGLEDSLARSRRQQESRQQLCELINLNERTLASLHEMEAEVRFHFAGWDKAQKQRACRLI